MTKPGSTVMTNKLCSNLHSGDHVPCRNYKKLSMYTATPKWSWLLSLCTMIYSTRSDYYQHFYLQWLRCLCDSYVINSYKSGNSASSKQKYENELAHSDQSVQQLSVKPVFHKWDRLCTHQICLTLILFCSLNLSRPLKTKIWWCGKTEMNKMKILSAVGNSKKKPVLRIVWSTARMLQHMCICWQKLTCHACKYNILHFTDLA